MLIEPILNSPLGVPVAERRMTFRLLSYWNRMRAGKPFANLIDINMEDISEIKDHCFVIDVGGDDVQDYRFLYIGKVLSEMFDAGKVGDSVEDAFAEDQRLGAVMQGYSEVMKTGEPLSDSGIARDEEGKLLYRTVLVPVSRNQKNIDTILGTTNYRFERAVPI